MRCVQGVLAPLVGVVLTALSSWAFVPLQGPTALSSRPHDANAFRSASSSTGVSRGSSLLRMQSPVAVDTIEQAQAIILSAAESRDQDPDDVIEAIRLIEKSGGSKKAMEGEGPQPKFDLLTTDGNWRLIFTTGDVKTQKKLGGKLTYVPIKAVQVFNPDLTITNGVYLGSFPLLKFTGTFTWAEEKARLEFTFDQIGVLGLTLPYKQGESKVQPGFTFMDISDRYVIARGAGGGLALWLRQDTI